MVDTWALVNDSMDGTCNEKLTATLKNLVEIIDHSMCHASFSKEA